MSLAWVRILHLPPLIPERNTHTLTKYRLIVYYEDRDTYLDLVAIARRHTIHIQHDSDKRAIVFNIDSTALLVLISRELYNSVE